MKKYGWTLRQALEIDKPPIREPSFAKPFEVEGKVFKSFRKACKHYKLDESMVRGRLSRNKWTVRQAFEIDSAPRKGRNSAQAKKIKVDGIEYASLSIAADKYNINRTTLLGRLKNNWTIRQAFNLDKPPPPAGEKNGKTINIKDKKFSSISKAEEFYKLRRGLAIERLNRGWTINQTFNLDVQPPPVGEKNGIPIRVKGKKFSSMKKASKFYGLKNTIVWKRINKFGWSINEAFGLLKRENKYL